MKSRLLPIFLIVLVDVMGLTIVIPLLGPYAERFGASPLQATMLVSVYALCQLFSGPLLGQWSDRVGRKPALLVSQIGTFLGFLLMARAEVLWVAFAARILDGITAGNLSIAQAYISDNTEPKDRTRYFGLCIGIPFGIGFFIGPGISGILAHAYGLHAPFFLAAALSLTSITCTATLLPGGRAQSAADDGPVGVGRRLSILQWSSYLPYVKQPVMRGLLLQFFFFVLSFSTFTSGFALFAERQLLWGNHPFTPLQIGYFFSYSGLLGIVLQGGALGRLSRKLGDGRLAFLGFVFSAAAYALLGFITRPAPLAVVTTLSAFGNGVIRPSVTSLVTQNASRSEQGKVLGLTQSLQAVGQSVAPLLGGALIQSGWLSGWAWSAAAFAVLGVVAGALTSTHASQST